MFLAMLMLAACSVFTGQAGDPFVEVMEGLARDGKIGEDVLRAVLDAYRNVLANSGDPWYVTLLSHGATVAGALVGVKLLPDKLLLSRATQAKLADRG
jgi:hypothetical protein